jgi:hypothetical protein
MLLDMKANKKFPEIKKTISAFLVGEEGKISKNSIIKAGLIISVAGIGLSKLAAAGVSHTNIIGTDDLFDGEGTATITHNHHASHSAGYNTDGPYEAEAEEPDDDDDDDDCCFVAGTLISMVDGTNKKIEDVKPGDEVISFDLKNNKTVNSIVKGKLEVLRKRIVYNEI